METGNQDDAEGEWYLDPESLYQNLLAHQVVLDLDGQSASGSAAEKAQVLRTLMATESFTNQQSGSRSGWQLADRLEQYTALMDGTTENGGLNNHRDVIEKRLAGVTPNHATWKFGGIPTVPTDAQMEDRVLSEDEFRTLYEKPLLAVQAKFAAAGQSGRVLAKRKAMPTYPNQTNPRRDTAPAHQNNPASSPAKPGNSQSGSVEGSGKNMDAVKNLFKSAKEQLVDGMVEKGETVPVELKTLSRQLSQPFVAPISERSKSSSVTAKPKMDADMQKLVELFEEHVVRAEDLHDVGEVVGLEEVKQSLELSIILPLMMECSGLNVPPKGLLLFGPPGTGKTLIGRWVASQLVKGNDEWKRTMFISITPSALTSKWIGESEKLVKSMFQYARLNAPAIIFMDEVDALLSRRNSEEHESSRRLKTEFLAQMEGVKTDKDKKVFVIGATNRPQEIDDAARRRFTHRLYVPLPDKGARKQMVEMELNKDVHSLTPLDVDSIAEKTDRFSGADIRDLCRDAFRAKFLRLRSGKTMQEVAKELQTQRHPIILADIMDALRGRTPSVNVDLLREYDVWKQQFGTGHF